MTLPPRWLIAFLLVAMAAAGWAADPRVFVVRDDTPVARQAVDLAVADLRRKGWLVDEAVVGEEAAALRADPAVAVLAFGARAATTALALPGARTVVGALLTQAVFDETRPPQGHRWSVILLDQPPERWANLLQTAFPGHSQAGMLLGPAGQKSLRGLERGLAERRVSLATETVSGSQDLIPALERLISRMQLLLALPDSVAHNRHTVQPLLLTTYRAGIPVVAYSEPYLQAGAVLALYTTVPQVVTQAVEALQAFQDGKAPASVQVPRYYTVGVNAAVARSLGLRLPPADELLDRLKALER